MARSLKKGPYVNEKLLEKVQGMNDGGKKKVIKTWSRRSMITPDFVGHTLAVHNGNKFIPISFNCHNEDTSELKFDLVFSNIKSDYDNINLKIEERFP